jgi:hypothetical protein
MALHDNANLAKDVLVYLDTHGIFGMIKQYERMELFDTADQLKALVATCDIISRRYGELGAA